MKSTKKTLERKIEHALERAKIQLDAFSTCEQKDNPQVVAMRLEASGRVEALQAVYLAMRGDEVELNILVG